MKRTTLINALWRAFYCKAFFTEVHQQWRLRIFALILVLSCLTSLSILIKPFSRITEFRTTANEILNQLPTVSFDKDCLLHINKDSPYSIATNNGNVLILFDMNASPKELRHKNALLFSFGQTGFYIHTNSLATGTSIRDFKPYANYHRLLHNLTLTPKQFITALSYLLVLMQIIVYGGQIITTFLATSILALGLAFIAMGTALVYRLPLTLGQSFRLSTLSLIPSALLAFILQCLPLPNYGLVNYALTALCFFYLTFIVHSLKTKPDSRNSHE